MTTTPRAFLDSVLSLDQPLGVLEDEEDEQDPFTLSPSAFLDSVLAETAPPAYEPPGRPIIEGPEGTISTERTVTIQDPRIHGGRWVNIPTIFDGQEVSQNEAVERIARSKGVDPETNRLLESFETVEEAVTAAQARSDSLGKALAGPEPRAETAPTSRGFDSPLSAFDQPISEPSGATTPRDPVALERGFVTGLLEQNPRLVGGFLEAVGQNIGSEKAIRIGREWREKPPAKDEYELQSKRVEDLETLDDYLTFVGEGVGSAATSTIMPLMGGLLGAKVGAAFGGVGSVPGAVIGAMGGAYTTAYPLNTGELYNSLLEEKVPEKQAARWAMSVGLITTAADALMPGGRALGSLTAQVRSDALKVIAKKIAKEGGIDAFREGGTEGIQDIINQSVEVALMARDLREGEVSVRGQRVLGSAGIGWLTGGGIGVATEGARFAKGDPRYNVYMPLPETDPAKMIGEVVEVVGQQEDAAKAEEVQEKQPIAPPARGRGAAEVLVEEEPEQATPEGQATPDDLLDVIMQDPAVAEAIEGATTPTQAAERAHFEANNPSLGEVIAGEGGFTISTTHRDTYSELTAGRRGAWRRMGIINPEAGQGSDTMAELLRESYPQYGIETEEDLIEALVRPEKMSNRAAMQEEDFDQEEQEALDRLLGGTDATTIETMIDAAESIEDLDAALQHFVDASDAGYVPIEELEADLPALSALASARRAELESDEIDTSFDPEKFVDEEPVVEAEPEPAAGPADVETRGYVIESKDDEQRSYLPGGILEKDWRDWLEAGQPAAEEGRKFWRERVESEFYPDDKKDGMSYHALDIAQAEASKDGIEPPVRPELPKVAGAEYIFATDRDGPIQPILYSDMAAYYTEVYGKEDDRQGDINEQWWRDRLGPEATEQDISDAVGLTIYGTFANIPGEKNYHPEWDSPFVIVTDGQSYDEIRVGPLSDEATTTEPAVEPAAEPAQGTKIGQGTKIEPGTKIGSYARKLLGVLENPNTEEKFSARHVARWDNERGGIPLTGSFNMKTAAVQLVEAGMATIVDDAGTPVDMTDERAGLSGVLKPILEGADPAVVPEATPEPAPEPTPEPVEEPVEELTERQKATRDLDALDEEGLRGVIGDYGEVIATLERNPVREGDEPRGEQVENYRWLRDYARNRLNQIGTAQPAPAPEPAAEPTPEPAAMVPVEGITMATDTDRNLITLKFDTKPDEATRQQLKDARDAEGKRVFTWNRKSKQWQGRITDEATELANTIAMQPAAPEPAAPEPAVEQFWRAHDLFYPKGYGLGADRSPSEDAQSEMLGIIKGTEGWSVTVPPPEETQGELGGRVNFDVEGPWIVPYLDGRPRRMDSFSELAKEFIDKQSRVLNLWDEVLQRKRDSFAEPTEELQTQAQREKQSKVDRFWRAFDLANRIDGAPTKYALEHDFMELVNGTEGWSASEQEDDQGAIKIFTKGPWGRHTRRLGRNELPEVFIEKQAEVLGLTDQVALRREQMRRDAEAAEPRPEEVLGEGELGGEVRPETALNLAAWYAPGPEAKAHADEVAAGLDPREWWRRYTSASEELPGVGAELMGLQRGADQFDQTALAQRMYGWHMLEAYKKPSMREKWGIDELTIANLNEVIDIHFDTEADAHDPLHRYWSDGLTVDQINHEMGATAARDVAEEPVERPATGSPYDPIPHTRYIMAGNTSDENRQVARDRGYGLILFPGMKVDVDPGQPWAIDNGAYSDYLARAEQVGISKEEAGMATPKQAERAYAGTRLDAVQEEIEGIDDEPAESEASLEYLLESVMTEFTADPLDAKSIEELAALQGLEPELVGIEINPWIREIKHMVAAGNKDDLFMVVLPDMVSHPLSHNKSIMALERVMNDPEMRDLPYYFVVQPGMDENTVSQVISRPEIAGVFIGGGPDFKTEMGPVYAEMAKEYGKKVHYGRSSSKRRMLEAMTMGADTMDTTWHQRHGSAETGGWGDVEEVDPHSVGSLMVDLSAEELMRLSEIDRQFGGEMTPFTPGENFATAEISDEMVDVDVSLQTKGLLQVRGLGRLGLSPRIFSAPEGEAIAEGVAAQEQEPSIPPNTSQIRTPPPGVPEQFDAANLGKALYDLSKSSRINSKKRMTDAARDILGDIKASPKEIEEAMEYALVLQAKTRWENFGGNEPSTRDRMMFHAMLADYKEQPTLNERTAKSKIEQAYSTPSVLGFIAQRLAGMDPDATVYEPTAGSGMLLTTANAENVYANEIDPTRQHILTDQGYTVTNDDAADSLNRLMVGNIRHQADIVLANPPFGALKKAVDVDGFKISKIDHLIAVNALREMQDQGRATLIVGASREEGTMTESMRIFLNYVYSNYNVVGHFEVDGDLYKKQGAQWPVKVIAIDGRATSENFAPTPQTIKRHTTWDEVYDAATGIWTQLEARPGSVGTSGLRPADMGGGPGTGTTPEGEPAGVRQPTPGQAGVAAIGGATEGATGGGGPGTGPSTGLAEGRVPVEGRPVGVPGGETGVPAPEGAGADTGLSGGTGEGQAAGPRGAGSGEPGDGGGGLQPGGVAGGEPGQPARVEEEVEEAQSEYQVRYESKSKAPAGTFTIPANTEGPLRDALDRIAEQTDNDLDEFVRGKLDYETVEALHKAYFGTQIDGLAMAINQIDRESALIIGDQTGTGKGRTAAGTMQYARQLGKTPIFFTAKPNLFNDMARDLTAIGHGDWNILAINNKGDVVREDGSVMIKKIGDTKRKQGLANMGNFDAIFVTYSQIHSPRNSAKRDALSEFINKDTVLILDEAHKAGGESNTGEYMREVLGQAHSALYLSATWAKRPDNMPLYFRTDIARGAGEDLEAITKVIERGGVPMQQVASAMLTRSGQYVRREMDMDNIKFESKVLTATADADIETADASTAVLRDIIAFDRIIGEAAGVISKLLAKRGKKMERPGFKVDHTSFGSVVHNNIKQMLLGIKLDNSINEIMQARKDGHKVVVAIDSTMGSMLKDLADDLTLKDGDALPGFDWPYMMERTLNRRLMVKVTDEKGTKRPFHILNDLDEEMEAELGHLIDILHEAHSGVMDNIEGVRDILMRIPGSPIDHLRNELTKRGERVHEITGRLNKSNWTVDYGERQREELNLGDLAASPDTPTLRSGWGDDRGDIIRAFNGGDLDIVIINKAGAEGLSLHASKEFKDQTPRKMIVIQPPDDINDFVQLLGRVNRAGQVIEPTYTLLQSELPAEKRPAAVISKKMKSLNANVTADAESDLSIKGVSDIMNEYGDEVAVEFVKRADMHHIVDELGMPETIDAAVLTGKLALAPVESQDESYDAIETEYKQLVELKTATGENKLVAKTFDLQAKTLSSSVIFEGDGGTVFDEPAHLERVDARAMGRTMSADDVVEARRTFLSEQGVDPNNSRAQMIYLEGVHEKLKQDVEAFIGTKGENFDVAAARAMLTDTRIALDVYGKIGDVVEIGTEGLHGILIGIATSHKPGVGNPAAPSKWELVYATDSPLTRTMRVPLSKASNIVSPEGDHISSRRLRSRYEELLSDSSSALSRQQRYIVTGNLVGGFDAVGTAGEIVSFTRENGDKEMGILLPLKWTPAESTGGRRMSNAADILAAAKRAKGEAVKSTDDGVRVIVDQWNNAPILEFLASKPFKDKYWGNEELLSLIPGGRDMQQRRGAFTTEAGALTDELVMPILEYLTGHGTVFRGDLKGGESVTLGMGFDPIEGVRAVGSLAQAAGRALTQRAQRESAHVSPDEELEARLEASKGLTPDALGPQIRDAVETAWNKIRREYEYLPKDAAHQRLRFALTRLQKQRGVASYKAITTLDRITAGLDLDQADLLRRVVLHKDFAAETARQIEAGTAENEGEVQLPYDLTVERNEAELARLLASVDVDPDVVEALRVRDEAWDALKAKYISSMEEIGFNVEDRFKNKDYFRHQVLDYANAKSNIVNAQGQGVTTNKYRGFLRQRKGSQMDINSEYLEAEYEVMASMVYDIEVARVLKVVKDEHDALPQLKQRARQHNDREVLKVFQEIADRINKESLRPSLGGEGLETEEVTAEDLYKRTLNVKQAIGFSKLRDLAALNELPDNGQWDDLIQWLSESVPDQGGTESFSNHSDTMPYLSWVLENHGGTAASSAAAMIFKGMSEKRATMKRMLETTKSFKTWEDFVPEGYTEFYPNERLTYFHADTIDANVMQQFMESNLEQLGVSRDQVQSIMAVGKRDPWVISENVFNQLAIYGQDKPGSLSKVLQWPLRRWKQFVLTGPRSAPMYNFRNLTGDAEAVMLGNPAIFLEGPRAARELWASMVMGRPLDGMLLEWFERGGAGSTLSVTELDEVGKLRIFEDRFSVEDRGILEKMARMPVTAFEGYWKTVRIGTDLRESVLRYAAYMYYKKQWDEVEKQAGPQGRLKNYAASNPALVDALGSPEDKAFMMSNQLLGAYDEVGVFGQWMSRHMMPFFRWMEVNPRRTWHLWENAYNNKGLMAQLGRSSARNAVRGARLSMATAASLGAFVLLASALRLAMETWNQLMFPEEEEELPDYIRDRPHVVLGRDPETGEVRYVARLGATSDLLDWAGLDVAPSRIQDYLNGTRTMEEIVIDMAKAPLNKGVNALAPHYKVIIEQAGQVIMWPDVTAPRRMRDRGLALASAYGVRHEYEAVADLPAKEYLETWEGVFFKKIDAGKAAYNNIVGAKRRFAKRIGKGSVGFSVTPRGNALYHLRLSIRLKDEEAIERYLQEYINTGGTLRGMQQSFNLMHPTAGGGLSKAEQKAFVAGLDGGQKAELGKAIDFYDKVLTGTSTEELFWGEFDRWDEKLTDQDRDLHVARQQATADIYKTPRYRDDQRREVALRRVNMLTDGLGYRGYMRQLRDRDDRSKVSKRIRSNYTKKKKELREELEVVRVSPGATWESPERTRRPVERSTRGSGTTVRMREPTSADYPAKGDANNIPIRLNNPGNLMAGGIADQFAMKSADGSPRTDSRGFLIFGNEEAGWRGLEADMRGKLWGEGDVGNLTLKSTLAEYNQVHAPDQPDWGRNVVATLNEGQSGDAIEGGDTMAEIIEDRSLQELQVAIATAEGFFENN